ncbi:MAG: carboxymuconolactone decarboxylase family protein [Pseudomonadota bacterium]
MGQSDTNPHTPTVHTIDTAPERSKPLLKNSIAGFGMIPNLHGVMAESPAMLEAYQRVHGLVGQSAFDAAERTVVWQAINVAHNCLYCVPAHTAIAHREKVDPELIVALRAGSVLHDTKLEALRVFTLSVLRGRGHVDATTRAAFHAAGYGKRHVLEVVLILSQKVMSNYVNHLFDTPLDTAFQPFAWLPAEVTDAA